MRLVGQLSRTCELAREQISLRLDEELSEFEQIALDGHLKACAPCRAYSASVGDVSARLRTASLDQPQFPIELPHRTRIHVPIRAVQVAAAAVAVAVVGLSSAGLNLTSEAHQSLSLRAAQAFPDRGPNLEPIRTNRSTVATAQRRTMPRPMSRATPV
jgi:predicted anti-sigma-YlaC factor YlaD